MIFSTNNIQTDIIKDILLEEREVALSVVRLDKLHPVISGNKLFKLHYFLKDTLPQSTAEIVTFGGAFPIILWQPHLHVNNYNCHVQVL